MNIVVLTKYYGRNYTGATLATYYFIENWLKLESIKEITVLCKEKKDTNINKKLIVKEYHSIFDLMNLINQEKNKCIFYSDDHLGWLLNIFKVKYVHTYHGNWPDARKMNISMFIKSLYFIPMYILTIKNAELVVNVSKYMKNFTDKYNSNSIIIRNGIDVKTKKIIFKNKMHRCIMIGNVDKRKYQYALNVIEKCNKQHIPVFFDIYGKIIDKKLYNQLSKLSNIDFKGYISDINFNNYDLLVCTSKIENLPITICEALKSNIPVISFNVGGITELINDNNGYIIENFDCDEMANKICDYCDSDIFLNTDNHALEDFDWNISANKYFKEFERIMK